MKHYFLGLAANYTRKERLSHTFAVGREKDCTELSDFLEQKYAGKAILCKNGRSALALALKAYFEPGDGIIVNGFTCYAVYEAIKAAGLKPVFADISKESLNYNTKTLSNALELCDSRAFATTGANDEASPVTTGASEEARESHNSRALATTVRGIIVQNTLGNPVDMKAVEKFAKQHDLTIIEDLAHCTGIKYPDGREAGTVGAAAALSFGKDKSIDTISGGAVVLRDAPKHEIKAPFKTPKCSDHLRARFYPLFGAWCRALTKVHLGGALMRCLVKIHWVEKSADNKLDLTRKISKFEAKLALKQLKQSSGKKPLRTFCLVENRDEILKKLAKNGYHFYGFWYEKPVSPERYYEKVHFPEASCPNAVYISEHIINLPNYYQKEDLAPALKIIKQESKL